MIPIVSDSWDRRIARAEELAARDEATRPLLVFYSRLLGLQRDVYDNVWNSQATNDPEWRGRYGRVDPEKREELLEIGRQRRVRMAAMRPRGTSNEA